MPKWTFAVTVNLKESPPNAGAAQTVGALIETGVYNELEDLLLLKDEAGQWVGDPVICSQPVEGTLRQMTGDTSNG